MKKKYYLIILSFIVCFNFYSNSQNALSSDKKIDNTTDNIEINNKNNETIYINLLFDFDKNVKVDGKLIYDLSNDPFNIMPKVSVSSSIDSSSDLSNDISKNIDNSSDTNKIELNNFTKIPHYDSRYNNIDNSSDPNYNIDHSSDAIIDNSNDVKKLNKPSNTEKPKTLTSEEIKKQKEEKEIEEIRVEIIKKKYITEPNLIENINKYKEIFFEELTNILLKYNIEVVNNPFPKEIKDQSDDNIDNSADVIKRKRNKRVIKEIPKDITPIDCKIIFLVYNRGEYNLITNVDTNIRLRVFINNKTITRIYIIKANINNPIELLRIRVICEKLGSTISKIIKQK